MPMGIIYFLIYKITNTVNGKIYVGVHRTKNLNDNYMGSGTALHRAYKKYGQEFFVKEILQIFDTQEEMFEAESAIVNEEFLMREDVYNLTKGGNGSWFFAAQKINNDTDARQAKNRKASIAMNAKCWANPEFVERKKKKSALILKKLHAEGKVKIPDWTGKSHRQETKNKIGKANSVHQAGEGNSQFGLVWIFNESEKKSYKVQKEEIETWILMGWKKGRKMSFSISESAN
jgi:hypothetical protein